GGKEGGGGGWWLVGVVESVVTGVGARGGTFFWGGKRFVVGDGARWEGGEEAVEDTAAPVVGAVRRAVHGMGGICPRDLPLGRQNCGHGHRPGRRVRTRLPAIQRRRPACECVRPRGIRYRHVLSGRTRSHPTPEYHN